MKSGPSVSVVEGYRETRSHVLTDNGLRENAQALGWNARSYRTKMKRVKGRQTGGNGGLVYFVYTNPRTWRPENGDVPTEQNDCFVYFLRLPKPLWFLNHNGLKSLSRLAREKSWRSFPERVAQIERKSSLIIVLWCGCVAESFKSFVLLFYFIFLKIIPFGTRRYRHCSFFLAATKLCMWI